MVWFMYQPINATFHTFLNKFQRDSGCLCESLRQANKQKCFLWVLLSNNAGSPAANHPNCSPTSSPRPYANTLLGGPLHSFPVPKSLSQANSHSCCGGCGATSCGLASWLWVLSGDLLVPLAGPPNTLALPGSAADFPKNPLRLQTGSSTWGHNCVFRPTRWTWTSILFCSQIYRVDFDSNILLSLQAQTCVCASSSIKSVNAAKICYHFLSLCCPV